MQAIKIEAEGCKNSIGVAQFIGIPSLPNLIGEFLINQQGLDVDFCEYGLMMTCR
ncbi:MAG: hypothetical protein V3R83_06765 [Gammaproteobacteria bacterium]